LQASGIDSVLKHVFYSGADGSLKDFTHIYVIVPFPDLQNYITVDPTNDCKYNAEVSSSKQTLYFLDGTKMELRYMGRPDGINGTLPGYTRTAPRMSNYISDLNMIAGSMENDLATIAGCKTTTETHSTPHFPWFETIIKVKCRSDRGNFDYTLVEEGQHYQNMINLYPARAAFLALVGLGNKFIKSVFKVNLAWRFMSLYNANPPALHKFWWQLGGSEDAAEVFLVALQGIGIKDFNTYFRDKGKKFPPLINGINTNPINPPPRPNSNYEAQVNKFRNFSIPTFNNGPEQPLDRPYTIPQYTYDNVINKQDATVEGIGYTVGMSDAVLAALIIAATSIIVGLINLYNSNPNSDPNLRGDGPAATGPALPPDGSTPITINNETYNIPNTIINAGVNAIENWASMHGTPLPHINTHVPLNTTPKPAGASSAGSFATHSIDNFSDLLNFCKGAGVILLGSSLKPALIIPSTIIVSLSFLYAIRNKFRFA
jgi:hypothetical protein